MPARSDAVWACSPKHEKWRERPVPLVLPQEDSDVRAWAIAVLDGAGIRWRQACCCGGMAAFEACVRARLGVGVFTAHTISNRLRILWPDEGVPLLPRAEGWIAKAGGSAPQASRLLHEFLVAEIRSRAGGVTAGLTVGLPALLDDSSSSRSLNSRGCAG